VEPVVEHVEEHVVPVVVGRPFGKIEVVTEDEEVQSSKPSASAMNLSSDPVETEAHSDAKTPNDAGQRNPTVNAPHNPVTEATVVARKSNNPSRLQPDGGGSNDDILTPKPFVTVDPPPGVPLMGVVTPLPKSMKIIMSPHPTNIGTNIGTNNPRYDLSNHVMLKCFRADGTRMAPLILKPINPPTTTPTAASAMTAPVATAASATTTPVATRKEDLGKDDDDVLQVLDSDDESSTLDPNQERYGDDVVVVEEFKVTLSEKE
jgi:hypothetical protein